MTSRHLGKGRMDIPDLMRSIARSDKFIVSSGAPKLLADCPWIDLSELGSSAVGSALTQEQKDRLMGIPPLPLPEGSLTVNCPIEGKPISMALRYYQLDEWIINSLAIHYIVAHDIAVPPGLKRAIESLCRSRHST